MRSLLLTSLLLSALPINAQCQTAGGMSDITVLSVDIGHFDYGHKIIHVYENSRNQSEYKDNPEKWQFVIEPLLSTTKGHGDAIAHKTLRLDSVWNTVGKRTILREKHRVLVPLELINNIARDEALRVILIRYPQATCKIGPSNIDVLPMVDANFTLSDIEINGFISKNAFMLAKNQGFLTSPKILYLYFDVLENSNNTDAELIRFIDSFPFMHIEATVSFSVKSTKFNISSITVDKIKNSNLYAKLNGTGGIGTVSRNDLRKLTQEAVSQLKAYAIIEDPASFSQDLFNSLLAASHTVTADEAFWNSQLGKETYNADDLKPDVVTKELNKLFTKDQGKDQWSFNSSASANANVLNLVSGGFSGSLSGSRLQEWLKEHNIETEIDGTKIIAKSIKLEQLNIANFLSTFNFSMEYRNISGASKQNLKTVIFGEPVDAITLPTALSFNHTVSACQNATSLLLR